MIKFRILEEYNSLIKIHHTTSNKVIIIIIIIIIKLRSEILKPV